MLWDERRGIFFVKRRKPGNFGNLRVVVGVFLDVLVLGGLQRLRVWGVGFLGEGIEVHPECLRMVAEHPQQVHQSHPIALTTVFRLSQVVVDIELQLRQRHSDDELGLIPNHLGYHSHVVAVFDRACHRSDMLHLLFKPAAIFRLHKPDDHI